MEEPRVTQVHRAFSMECAVELPIHAAAPVLWRLLTDPGGFPHWNSTISRIEGEIREGQRLRLHVPGTSRTFTPTVSGCGGERTHDVDRRVRPRLQGCAHVRADAADGWRDRVRDGRTLLGPDPAPCQEVTARLRPGV